MASCFCRGVNRRLVVVRLFIDGQSEGHGVTPIDMSTKPGQPHYPVLKHSIEACQQSELVGDQEILLLPSLDDPGLHWERSHGEP